MINTMKRSICHLNIVKRIFFCMILVSMTFCILTIIHLKKERTSSNAESTQTRSLDKAQKEVQLTTASVETVDPRKREDLKKELKIRLANATNKKIILVWRIEGESAGWSTNIEACGNCFVSYNKAMINDKDTGAVVMFFETMTHDKMPPKESKNPDHLYIFHDRESSSHRLHMRSFEFEDNFGFNATMSYRFSSDFYTSYDFFNTAHEILADKVGHDRTKIMQHKKKTAVILVSNCDSTPTPVFRYDLIIKIMKTGFPLEAYGKCFPSDKIFANGADRVSRRFLDEIRKYKFYFAFENSYHCKDYISEKFFYNALRAPAVPVVWGATKEDYEAVVPRNSFIYAEDFANVQELVKYLQYLDKNDTAYMEYFEWYKLDPSDLPLYGQTSGLCQICRVLHGINYDDIYNSKYNPANPTRPLFTDGVSQRIVPSIRDYFFKEEREECWHYIHNRSFLGE